MNAAPATNQTANSAQRPPVGDTGAIDAKAASSPDNAPRRRGRPKGLPKTGGRKAGVKNWTSAEIRNALLGRSDAVDTLADIVAGRQVRVSGPTGKTLWRYPTMVERLSGLKMLLDKCVPSLQATELTGKDGQALFETEPAPRSPRQIARAILAVLSSAVPDHKVSLESPGTHVAKFHDPDLGKRVLPDNPNSDTARACHPTSGALEGEGAFGASDSASSPPSSEIGTTELIGENGHFIELRQIDGGGREKWFVCAPGGTRIKAVWDRAAAIGVCQELIDTKHIISRN